MKQLHWLPISQRIIYKIVLITYKSLNGSAPHYINNMLKPYTPSANLRSSSKGLLVIPSVKLVNYGERSFSYAAPKLWNELPEYIRKSETLPIFKTGLKTHLFKQYYDKGPVYMKAGLARLARQPGKRDEFLLCLYEKISSRLPGQFCYIDIFLTVVKNSLRRYL
jgi:hypothetical protein